MFYLLQDPTNQFALVSSDGSADGWYPSLPTLDLDLPYSYIFHNKQPAEAFFRGGHTVLYTFLTRPTQSDLLALFPEYYL